MITSRTTKDTISNLILTVSSRNTAGRLRSLELDLEVEWLATKDEVEGRDPLPNRIKGLDTRT